MRSSKKNEARSELHSWSWTIRNWAEEEIGWISTEVRPDGSLSLHLVLPPGWMAWEHMVDIPRQVSAVISRTASAYKSKSKSKID